MPKLVVIDGPNRGAVLNVAPGENCMGRDQDLTLALPDRSVSRRHAAITYDPATGALLSDLGSTNATYINGMRLVAPHKVMHGDELRLGDTVLLYLTDGDGPPSAGTNMFEDTSKLAEPG